MTMIRKTFAVSRKTIDAEQGIYEAVISTEEQDRDGDVIRAAGIDVQNYLRNPIVLAGHDYHNLESVVGKTLELTVTSNEGLRARFQFAPGDVNPKAEMVRRLWAGEFLNATSIGFIPKKARPRAGGRGQEFEEIELLEFSVVSVPSNQSALALRSLDEFSAQETKDINERALELLKEYFDLDVAAEMEQKRGRVLSAANEAKLKSARDALDEVLAQLDAQNAPDRGANGAAAEERKGALAPHRTPRADADSGWDGPAVVAALPNDAAVLRKVHAWVDENGDPDAKQSYKFPHHLPDGRVVLRGVNNALARLSQANIPDADRAGVVEHLRTHQQQFADEKDLELDATSPQGAANENSPDGVLPSGTATSDETGIPALSDDHRELAHLLSGWVHNLKEQIP